MKAINVFVICKSEIELIYSLKEKGEKKLKKVYTNKSWLPCNLYVGGIFFNNIATLVHKSFHIYQLNMIIKYILLIQYIFLSNKITEFAILEIFCKK